MHFCISEVTDIRFSTVARGTHQLYRTCVGSLLTSSRCCVVDECGVVVFKYPVKYSLSLGMRVCLSQRGSCTEQIWRYARSLSGVPSHPLVPFCACSTAMTACDSHDSQRIQYTIPFSWDGDQNLSCSDFTINTCLHMSCAKD